VHLNKSKAGLLLVFLTAIISGFSIFINSFGVKGFDSSVFTFSKNVVVALFLFSIIIFLKQFNELKKLNKKQWLNLIGIGLIGGSIPFLLFFKGLQMATGAAAGFIHKTIFVYVAVFALLFLKEKLTKSIFIGALLLLVRKDVFWLSVYFGILAYCGKSAAYIFNVLHPIFVDSAGISIFAALCFCIL